MPNDDARMGFELVKEWAIEFDKLWKAVDGCFFRHDLRGRAKGYVRGLFGRVEWKNGWQMAEYLGDATPHPVQRLLDRAIWNADDVRDEIIRYRHITLQCWRWHSCPQSVQRRTEVGRKKRPKTSCL